MAKLRAAGQPDQSHCCVRAIGSHIARKLGQGRAARVYSQKRSAPRGPERQIPPVLGTECGIRPDTAIAAVKLYHGKVGTGWSCRDEAKRASFHELMFLQALFVSAKRSYQRLWPTRHAPQQNRCDRKKLLCRPKKGLQATAWLLVAGGTPLWGTRCLDRLNGLRLLCLHWPQSRWRLPPHGHSASKILVVAGTAIPRLLIPTNGSTTLARARIYSVRMVRRSNLVPNRASQPHSIAFRATDTIRRLRIPILARPETATEIYNL